MEDVNEMLAEQQRELERIRKRRSKGRDMTSIRKTLNILFLVVALIGILLYFCYPDKHVFGLAVIGIGMFLKIAEFFIRFMF